MAAEGKAVEQAADELYGLPLDEFTRARDERAKELRKEGDPDAANAVKALRKPTVAAWALNQLARTRAKDVERLMAAGEKLQSAQEELLAGGDRAAFQRAAAEERELVAELAGEAEPGLAEKIAATLRAAALDSEVADGLRVGRLVREREAIGGFGTSEPGTEPTPRAKSKFKPKSKSKTGRSSSRADESAQRDRVAGARTDERHAKRELDAAARALEHARARAEAAKAHAAEANERAKTTADRLKEARRAESAARKAHERATRALESAERGSSRSS